MAGAQMLLYRDHFFALKGATHVLRMVSRAVRRQIELGTAPLSDTHLGETTMKSTCARAIARTSIKCCTMRATSVNMATKQGH
jgi:hypothetical protein